ncbi:glycoside hydrolase family 6 protein [Actinoplanes sp. NEAU-A12]|uniref:Glucanase n=1 Tax=Actinoplanes sandaracinus TaxID=3045177 RepID=A0ABT6WBR7_9ACTN|nr:glycoside hydrolase family 6 protein [Actinoplanes sandaracinus]MDI6097182.1 glycoside hydrolase family 6 protein [Actinoplanes sandaracinus]
MRNFPSLCRLVPSLCGLAAVVVLAGCTSSPGTAPSGKPTPATAVPESAGFYVEPDAPAAQQVAAWEAEGRTRDAAALRRIAGSPTAVWFADANPGFQDRARRLVEAATAAGRTAVLVPYYVPQRDCGGHSGGGAPDAASYRTWIADLAAVVRGNPAIVVLEPDAVPHLVDGCLDPAAAKERLTLLGEAIQRFKQQPGVRVYLDAGNPGWIKDVDRVAAALGDAGIRQADGFSLNVANFETTEANIAYGTAVSDRVGGLPFVIDTSRNGNGPAPVDARDADGHWCNPPGRALGPAPTTDTGTPRVAAYLWVKRPGESDGACLPDAPPAGQWWPEYALGLATN